MNERNGKSEANGPRLSLCGYFLSSLSTIISLIKVYHVYCELCPNYEILCIFN